MENFNKILYRIIGERISHRRKELGLTQKELSEKTATIGRSSISNIEKGNQQPALHTLYTICSILDIDVQRILPTYKDVMSKSNTKHEEIFKLLLSSDTDEITRNAIKELMSKK